jgi:hypothetical protein
LKPTKTRSTKRKKTNRSAVNNTDNDNTVTTTTITYCVEDHSTTAIIPTTTSTTLSNAPSTSTSTSSDYSIDMWNPCSELRKPVIVIQYDPAPSSVTIAGEWLIKGCNKAFRKLFGYTSLELQFNFDISKLLCERLRDQWREILPYFINLDRATISGYCIGVDKNENEHILRFTAHFTKSFIFTIVEQVDHFCDEWVVNDVVYSETFRVENPETINKLTMPANSFKRLIDILNSLKSSMNQTQQHYHFQQYQQQQHQQHQQIDKEDREPPIYGSVFGSPSILIDLLDDHERTAIASQMRSNASSLVDHQQHTFDPILLSSDEIEQVMFRMNSQ